MKRSVSLQTRLLAYLEAHPYAELTRQQIMDTFHVGVKHVDKTLYEMRADGLIETVHVTRLPKAFRAELNAAISASTLALRTALEIAVRQNEHDMLMTGEELRACRAALAGPGPNVGGKRLASTQE